MRSTRIKAACSALALVAAAWLPMSGEAQAQDNFPSKPVTIYIAFGAGGTSDIMTRAFGAAAEKYLGGKIVYVNRTGAGGTLAAMAVRTAAPDGYSLGVAAASNTFVAPNSPDAPYKDLSGFTFICNFVNYVYPLMVRDDAPWKTWKEFVDYARQNPRGAKIAITGARSVASQGLVLWQVEQREKVQFAYVPMTSSADILNATLGGHVTMYGSSSDATTIPYLKEKKVRILSYLSKEKIPGYEDVPSLQDLYGFSLPNLGGLFGPKGIPEPIVKKLEDAFAKAAKDPEFVKVMERMYTPVAYMDRAQMNKYISETAPRVAEIMKSLRAEEAKDKK